MVELVVWYYYTWADYYFFQVSSLHVIFISKVTSDSLDFESDDLLTQIEALITRPGRPIEYLGTAFVSAPELPSRTFDFDDLMNVWLSGFDEASRMIDSLPAEISSELIIPGASNINQSRAAFRDQLPIFSPKILKISGLKSE